MARKPRIWFPGATFHITSRGNRRASIFYDDDDCFMYLTLLEETRMQFPFLLHAYCLMSNHIHLLLETQDHSTSIIMKDLHAKYAIYFNKRHQFSGHLFQGRYGGHLVKDNDYFLQVSRYIHLNPVKAGLVRNPVRYPWSSYHAFVTPSSNIHITSARTLSSFSPPSSFHYQQFIKQKIKDIL
ncbi:transposase [Salibacterium salarium]|uniref:Transposase n=1 Tax=Salibacterium salarium TaxID=284579 RepID=A0A428N9Q0_9BACI|nr:transposase [Salibacterium salarium]RSL35103.1 transposase [Salibacterium salarium]